MTIIEHTYYAKARVSCTFHILKKQYEKQIIVQIIHLSNNGHVQLRVDIGIERVQVHDVWRLYCMLRSNKRNTLYIPTYNTLFPMMYNVIFRVAGTQFVY